MRHTRTVFLVGDRFWSFLLIKTSPLGSCAPKREKHTTTLRVDKCEIVPFYYPGERPGRWAIVWQSRLWKISKEPH